MAADIVPHLPSTIAALPLFVGSRYADSELLARCRADGVTWMRGRDLVPLVREISLGLTSLGMAPGDRVAMVCESRPEWVLTDFAILCAGAASASVYPTLAPEQVAYIVRDCGASMVVVSTAQQLDKVLSVAASIQALRTVIVVDPPETLPTQEGFAVLSLADVIARGRQVTAPEDTAAFEARAQAVTPDDLATLIYTSGTTGEPKGVMLTHRNLASNLRDICAIFPVSDADTALSFLPLSHSFERMVAWVYLANGLAMAFAESNETIGRDLLQVRPTVMTGVPRVFEKLQSRILEKGGQLTGVKGRLFQWAMRVARARGEYVPDHRPMPFGLRVQSVLADRLVLGKVRDGLGGRFRFVVSGSAALNVEVARFFFGLGLPIIEGFGLTETSPVLTVTPLTAVRLGAVGVPIPNVEIRIADDGEILAKGPNIMVGYYNRPADSAEVLRDGWFHTGDIGTLDADGYLRITDRKKELIVTSGGKKLAPQAIEALCKANPLIGEAVVVGEGRHFPAVLLVPDFAALAAHLHTQVPPTTEAVQAWLAQPEVQAVYAGIIEAINQGLAQYERLKQFRLLPREFTLASGELTPTFKVKRRVIDTMYAAEIASIYQ
jgi:long-chain acyl-CoA synthetase